LRRWSADRRGPPRTENLETGAFFRKNAVPAPA
jgi:hypothetical protein